MNNNYCYIGLTNKSLKQEICKLYKNVNNKLKIQNYYKRYNILNLVY